jgi:hypothetical protein
MRVIKMNMKLKKKQGWFMSQDKSPSLQRIVCRLLDALHASFIVVIIMPPVDSVMMIPNIMIMIASLSLRG